MGYVLDRETETAHGEGTERGASYISKRKLR